ncbi:polysaccharide deacetylase family protein [Pseudonocardia endophytica]|uniref:Polysaccharide deacetylase n=1 Tax=Pseudonocardia endophytica TaxID=401976 RepID=A0A4R1HFJ5_PSEEN|nr:polysaccharide deacetylase family protein [Pseudonocardia endophytica]TCK20897.1 polysaccharide deacetylase [Pseudonocardia endophytica]
MAVLRRAVLRTALVLVAVLAIAVPVTVTRWLGAAVAAPPSVRDQVVTAAPAAADAAYERFSGDPAVTARIDGAVLVLTYHDIAPAATGEYTITPQAFAEQLAMLRDAGFTSVSAETLLASRTDPTVLPARPVVITFDDGTGGVWRYADPLLAEYGFRGIAFVITGRVGEHYPYYLTWDELTAMHDSGRWDVESHTAAGHDRHDVGGGHSWPFLINRLRLPDGTLETADAARARLSADADTAVATLQDHGLGRPDLFAYPFSASLTPTNDPATAQESRRILADRYALLFTNDGDPHWATPADLDAGVVPRIEVTAGVTADALFQKIVAGLPAPDPDDARPLLPGSWTDARGARATDAPSAPVSIRGTTITVRAVDASGTTAYLYRNRAARWTDYTVSGTWSAHPDGYSALLLREGSPGALRLSVGAGSMKLSTAAGTDLATYRITESTTHAVSVTLAGTEARVTVDGRALPPVTVPDPGPVGGAIGLRVAGSPVGTTVDGLRIAGPAATTPNR